MTVAGPAHAASDHSAGSQQPEVVASGLAGPLSVDVGNALDVYVTQNFAGLLSTVDQRGRVSTVHELGLPPDAGELTGVAYRGRFTYHIETDYSGAQGPVSHIIRTSRTGERTVVSDDLWAYEVANNPDGDRTYGFTDLDAPCAAELQAFQEGLPPERELPPLAEYSGIVESHAYQLDVRRGTIYVADAAANAVLAVDESTGDITTVSVLPATPIEFTADVNDGLEGELGLDLPDCLVGNEYTPEPVPTDVQADVRGDLYVSTLEGAAGEMAPLSKVYRVNRSTGSASTIAGGMFGATGLAVDNSGDIFVAELFGGKVSMIKRGGSRAETVFAADSPADVALRGRTIFATTGVFGDGALVKYRR
ncbi:ScyD/ScyE family protein [Janibacter alittae]|uniref:ScyD/ScyE family protein n=1 Tax=Janibacter alittae TaxID=3115209 RepID=A0ABZ2MJH6_9MICO